MKVLKYPDPFLFKKLNDITSIDNTLISESQEMIRIMKESEGVGLAANQVGVDKRMFVMHCIREKEPYIFVNPEIILIIS